MLPVAAVALSEVRVRTLPVTVARVPMLLVTTLAVPEISKEGADSAFDAYMLPVTIRFAVGARLDPMPTCGT